MNNRQTIRDETNRRMLIYFESCSCGAPQPTFNDLKLERHRPDCFFVVRMERELELSEERTPLCNTN